MIDIKIFEVERGFCAAINTSDSRTILIDCGSGSQFKPSQYIWQRHCHSLDYLVLPAYTKDHLAGFPELVSQSWQHDIPIHFLVANPTVNLKKFSDLKSFLSQLNKSLITLTDTSQTIEIDELKLTFFWNKYPDLQAPHNLSLVTFIKYRDINTILPSDLETDGWQNLLQSADFRQRLERVNVFVAANHGQETGYCQEVFRYCHPEIIIVSNKENRPISSHMMRQYHSHAKGAPSGVSEKKVFTTYDDGTIVVSKYLDRLRQVTTQRQSKPSVSLNTNQEKNGNGKYAY
jgi:beta-lactamase superfamily II metal-dependent hydrolase